MRRKFVVAAFFFLITNAAASASANDGYVYGYLYGYQALGGACPTSDSTRDCGPSARYPDTEFQFYVPIKYARVRILDSGGSSIGVGYTDSNGFYFIYWTRSGSGNFTGHVRWEAVHGYNRFEITNGAGSYYVFGSGNFTILGNGAYTPRGTLYWGKNELMTLFMAAEMMWEESLTWSNAVYAVFDRATIRGVWSYESGVPTAYSPTYDVIDVQQDGGYKGDVMHEMAHRAVHLVKPYKSTKLYNYPDMTTEVTGGTYGGQTPEWDSFGFDEALAEFFQNVAYYWSSNKTPVHSSGVGVAFLGTDMELSSGLPGNCEIDIPAGKEEDRWVFTSVRYLRDVYDSTSTYDSYTDSVSVAYGTMFDTWVAYPSGQDDHEINEPFLSSQLSAYDEPDGRGAADYYYHLLHSKGVYTGSQWLYNCAP